MQITKLLSDIARFFTYRTSVNPASQDEYQAFIKNLHAVTTCLVDGLWQPNTEYALNHVIRTPNMPRGYIAKVVTAGVSDANEPDWGDGKKLVTDGAIQWKLVKEIPTVNGNEADSNGEFTISPLIAYPVGSIYMSTVSTSPATLFGGTWEEMPAGRVLMAQGTSEWGTTYAAGSTGGEATHTLTVGEMPSHNHSGSAASGTISRHYHGVSSMGNNNGYFYAVNSAEYFDSKVSGRRFWNGSGDGGDFESSAVGSAAAITSLEKSNGGTTGGHSHTITIGNQGSNSAHNNMQPYINVFMWKRTA